MRRTRYAYIIVIGVVLLSMAILVSQWEFPAAALRDYVAQNHLWGGVVFAGVMFVATVLAPFSALPLVPLIAPILGPFSTAIACVVGWTLGAIVAFLIARYGGRPLIARFTDIQKLEAYELKIPQKTHFLFLVMLRMVIPVDVLSYALGLVSTVKIGEYVLTTVIGILWFSFAFAYLGDAFFTSNYVLLGGISVASVFILSVAFFYVKTHIRHDHTEKP